MFSLIVVIVSIALVAVLALAVIYYGGSAFNTAGNGADVSKLLNEGQQISGAAVLHKVKTGDVAANIDELITGQYLRAKPGANWQVYQDTAVVAGITQNSCLSLNQKAGLSTIPLCTDPITVGNSLCCESIAP